MSDYILYRGKCKEMCEELLKEDSSLTLVRGYYMCPIWGKQPHWWLKDSDGKVIDPSVRQFPTKGIAAEYIEFDGTIVCANCGNTVKEEEAEIEGNYGFCTHRCHGLFIGVF